MSVRNSEQYRSKAVEWYELKGFRSSMGLSVGRDLIWDSLRLIQGTTSGTLY